MAGKRSFSKSDIQQKAVDYHGSSRYVRTSPDVAAAGVKSVNIEFGFEDALRLSLAIQSAILNLNRYNRSRKEGNEMGLCLSVKTDVKSISVIEVRVRPEAE